jgi:hypothetical protein
MARPAFQKSSFAPKSWRVALLAGWLAVFLPACDEPDAEEIVKNESTFAEKHDGATIYWNVSDDGKAQFVVKNEAGTLITHKLAVDLVVTDGEGDEPIEVEVKEDPERGVFTAELPTTDGPTATI